ncbi:hypothetical protein EON64_06135 [archaeon]|nr:MAG: hypothetical protein EON64_06135 [archaeon]
MSCAYLLDKELQQMNHLHNILRQDTQSERLTSSPSWGTGNQDRRMCRPEHSLSLLSPLHMCQLGRV